MERLWLFSLSEMLHGDFSPCPLLLSPSFGKRDSTDYARAVDEHLINLFDGQAGSLGVEKVYRGDDGECHACPYEIETPSESCETKRSRH